MTLFKRKHLRKILRGEKTQTRRIHKHTWKLGKIYGIRTSWFRKSEGYIKIIRKFRQKLGDISLEDIKKEGYSSLEEFRRAWEEINGLGSWDPDLIVTVYEFAYVEKKSRTAPFSA